MEKPIIDRELLTAVLGDNISRIITEECSYATIIFDNENQDKRKRITFKVDKSNGKIVYFRIHFGYKDNDKEQQDIIEFNFDSKNASIEISSDQLNIHNSYSTFGIRNLLMQEKCSSKKVILKGKRYLHFIGDAIYSGYYVNSGPDDMPSKFTLETYLPEQKEPDYEDYSILESKTLYKIISSHVVSYQTANAIYCILKHMGVAENKIGPLFEALLSNLTLSDKMKKRMFAGEEGINKLNKTVSDIAHDHYYTQASFAEMLTNLRLPIDEKCTSANFGDDYKAKFSYISPDQPSVNRKRVYASFKGEAATSLGFSTEDAKFYVYATEGMLKLRWNANGSANVLRIYSDGYVDYGFTPNEKDVSSSITVYDFSTAQESKDLQNEFVQTCKEIKKECGSELTTDIDISKEILRNPYFNKIIHSIIRRCVGRNNTQGQELALVYLQNIFTPLAHAINPEVEKNFNHILENRK